VVFPFLHSFLQVIVCHFPSDSRSNYLFVVVCLVLFAYSILDRYCEPFTIFFFFSLFDFRVVLQLSTINSALEVLELCGIKCIILLF